MAAISVLGSPTINRFTVSDMYKPEVKKEITPASTLYIPPKDLLPVSLAGEMIIVGHHAGPDEAPKFPPLPIHHYLGPEPDSYGEQETRAVAALKHHVTPADYRRYSASPAMQMAVESFTLDPEILKAYQESPSAFAASIPGLLDREAKALASGSPTVINDAMWTEGVSVLQLAIDIHPTASTDC